MHCWKDSSGMPLSFFFMCFFTHRQRKKVAQSKIQWIEELFQYSNVPLRQQWWIFRTFWEGTLSLPDIGLGVRVFANGPGDLGSIPGRVIPKTQKMVLDASLLNTLHYKVRIKGKVEQSREGVAPSPTHWCSSYRKGSLRVTLDYGRQLYLFYIIVVKQPWFVLPQLSFLLMYWGNHTYILADYLFGPVARTKNEINMTDFWLWLLSFLWPLQHRKILLNARALDHTQKSISHH